MFGLYRNRPGFEKESLKEYNTPAAYSSNTAWRKKREKHPAGRLPGRAEAHPDAAAGVHRRSVALHAVIDQFLLNAFSGFVDVLEQGRDARLRRELRVYQRDVAN